MTGDDILGCNLFAYCGNNPINNMDIDGHSWKSIKNWIKATYTAIKTTVNNVVKKAKDFIQTASKSLPLTGKPNSTKKLPNGNEREYGSDGRATKDNDYSHPQHHPNLPNPHSHDWTWTNGIPTRGPAYDPNKKEVIAGIAITGISIIITAAIVADDATVVGIIDDMALPSSVSGIARGIIMIFEGA